MKNLRKATITGHLASDPQTINLDNGKSFVAIRLGCTNSYTKDGEKIERTEWFNLTTSGKNAEYVSKYFKKGQRVLVEAQLSSTEILDELSSRKYQTVKMYLLDIMALSKNDQNIQDIEVISEE